MTACRSSSCCWSPAATRSTRSSCKDEEFRALAGQIDTLTAYRKSLIHECVTGQRRITEADLKAQGEHE